MFRRTELAFLLQTTIRKRATSTTKTAAGLTDWPMPSQSSQLNMPCLGDDNLPLAQGGTRPGLVQFRRETQEQSFYSRSLHMQSQPQNHAQATSPSPCDRSKLVNRLI